ncbi:hypothetical protein K438DRAFT_1985516 [Mycena galopus ATCC 62051]|nr:hypothetical protein K438DRAFT_1985516 [Mycena galopus ATCC 62051]
MSVIDNTSKRPATESTPLLGHASGSSGPSDAPEAGPVSTTQILYAVHQPVHLNRRRWAFIAFIALINLCMLASLYVAMVRILRGPPRHYEYPIPNDVDLERCVTRWVGETKNDNISFYPYSVSTSFDFPLPSKTLFLLSKGVSSSGHLKITTSAEITDVRANVTVQYYKPSVRDATKVCMIERYRGETGVAIFTPSHWRSYAPVTDRLSFNVELILPRTESMFYVPGLSTDVDNFSHDVDSLNFVQFGDISLAGTNGKIQAELLAADTATFTSSHAGVIIDSLVARRAEVRTSNGRISGSYNVSDSLDLRTSNAPIDVAIAVNSSDNKKPKNLVVHTSNGVLQCTIDLGTTLSKTPSAFNIDARTSNAVLQAHIASAPLDSVLTVGAKTSNRQASLTLPSTYEGSFKVSTSHAPSAVEHVNPNEQDPACEPDGNCDSRARTVEWSTVRRSIAGNVYWDEKNANRGRVSLTSSNGPATLYV